MTNVIIMSMLNYQRTFLMAFFVAVTSVTSLSWQTTQAADFTGRFSMLGTTANASQGDLGYINKDNLLSADQQSVRLMLDDTLDNSEWSLHLKTSRLSVSDFTLTSTHSSDLFRYNKLSSNWLNETSATSTTRVGYEIDRALYKQRFKSTTLALGRQPIDWGSGNFWQPLNVFGAFAPTDLDTDFKPGIDAARLDWFPSDFSSLTAVYAFSPADNTDVADHASAALHYQSQLGEESQFALLAAGIIGNRVIGASFESAWGGMGWRIEAANTHFLGTNEDSLLWIAGLNYQFSDGTLLTAEWYDNSRGANSVASLKNTNFLTDPVIKYGLQQQLTQNVLGISLNKEITPLLNGSYTLLVSPIKDVDSKLNASLLHQFSFIYSVSNESDLLFSFQVASGRGRNQLGQLQSEFGHVPASMTVRLRFYF